MNSFEAMGEARLQAAEGQRQLAIALVHGVRHVLTRALAYLTRHKR